MPFFAQYYLVANANPPKSLEDEPIDLTMLACPIFDFVFKISRTSKAKNWLTLPNVEALVIAMFGWMQMTEDDVSYFICSSTALFNTSKEENWGSDANAFVAHEDDDSQSYSTRVAGLDLLGVSCDPKTSIQKNNLISKVLMEREPAITVKALSQALTAIVTESQQARSSGSAEWYGFSIMSSNGYWLIS